jgi:hypothetical protein
MSEAKWPEGFRERAQEEADKLTAKRVAVAWGVPSVRVSVDGFTGVFIVEHPAGAIIASGATPARALAGALEVAPEGR